ncbi:RNA pseudouridylate synthase domain-containing protein 3-like isoform X2 [Zootermopsis nevadensis]|nr:RNA pseudouridylate synthase domain-containing protein 3-like isoform X2 [Zootermopsis nevadensis]
MATQHSRRRGNILVGQKQYYLTEALPHIAGNLGYNSLTVLKKPERYTSGVTVLSSCEKVLEKVKKCIKKASGRQQLCAHYWAVVIGNPQPDSAFLKLGLTLKENPCISNDKQPVVMQKWSNKAVKQGDVKVFRVEHHTLYRQNFASLVEICPSATKWHFLRVYLAHLLSPVLGDNMYGSRVHQVMGVPLAINPCSDAARGPKNLPQKLLEALSIKPGQEIIIPTHLHLRRLILPHYLGKDSDLIIEAPLPSSFQWTCKSLGLHPAYDAENISYAVSHDR